MKRKIPFDLGCIFVIAVKNGNRNDICSALKLNDISVFEWKIALKKTCGKNNSDENGYFENVAVSSPISSWNYILCDKFSDSKYTLNCCNNLSEKYSEIFSFGIDVHSGIYRFLKIENKVITRFFERNYNQETGEFGVKLKEETDLNGNDYFYVVNVVKKVLRLAGETHFGDALSVGKRYYHEAETYKELYMPPTKLTDNQGIKLEDNEVPF